jgi:hypothetical protein
MYEVRQFNSRNGPMKKILLVCAPVVAVAFEVVSL